jgi:hypothetical protein
MRAGARRDRTRSLTGWVLALTGAAEHEALSAHDGIAQGERRADVNGEQRLVDRAAILLRPRARHWRKPPA